MNNRYNLSNLEALFKDFLITARISRISIKNYTCDIRHFLTWFMYARIDEKNETNHLDIFIDSISEAIIEDYIEYHNEDNLPASTINRRLSSLRKFFTFCSQREIVAINPMSNIRNVAKPVLKREIKDVGSTQIELPAFKTAEEDFTAYLEKRGEELDESLINELKNYLQ